MKAVNDQSVFTYIHKEREELVPIRTLHHQSKKRPLWIVCEAFHEGTQCVLCLLCLLFTRKPYAHSFGVASLLKG